MTRSCENCSIGYTKDFGYSNYTVEGTDFVCPHHPEKRFDRWYGRDNRLSYANECEHYTEGYKEHYAVEDEEPDDE